MRGPWLCALAMLPILLLGSGLVAGPRGVTVSGTALLRNGKPFVIKGVQIVGLVAPDAALRGQYAVAHEHFGQAELAAARSWGANTIRFQLSEPGLDPASSLYSTAYLKEIQAGVGLALKDGFVVILSIQDQSPSGETNPWPMPTAATARDWATLVPLFKTDDNVLFELFNEPALPANAEDWQLWAYGGTAPPWHDHGAFAAVGAQTLIDQIRAAGAKNVILVDGLSLARTLQGQPVLRDPAHELAYAVHPYFGTWMEPDPVAAWTENFGQEATVEPVVVTEWAQWSGQGGCKSDFPTLATQLVDYIRSRRIGLVGFAFDIPGTIIASWNYAPTTYADFQCSVKGDGPGALMETWYNAKG